MTQSQPSNSPTKPGTNSDLNNYIFTYEEAANLAKEDIKFRSENPNVGVPFTAWGFGRNCAPAGPGELVLTIGRPGHLKTGALSILADARDKQLKDLGQERHILFVTAETTVEKLMANFIAADTGISKTDIAWGKMTDDNYKIVDRFPLLRTNRNIWFYGNSSQMASKRYVTPASMKPETIANAIDAVANWRPGKLNVIDLVIVDYFQMLEPNRYDSESRVRYENVMRDMKRIAISLPGPLFMACQAKQAVDQQEDPLPKQNDIEQTNEGHKDSDIIISTLVPNLYPDKLRAGSTYHDIVLKQEYLDNLMLLSLRKHKSSGIKGNEHWVFCDFKTNRITNLKPFVRVEMN